MNFFILALATWRISSLLTNPGEAGPYGMLDDLHGWVDQNQDKSEVAKALTCLWCTSVWVGVMISVIYFVAPKFAEKVALPLALSTLAISMDKWNG